MWAQVLTAGKLGSTVFVNSAGPRTMYEYSYAYTLSPTTGLPTSRRTVAVAEAGFLGLLLRASLRRGLRRVDVYDPRDGTRLGRINIPDVSPNRKAEEKHVVRGDDAVVLCVWGRVSRARVACAGRPAARVVVIILRYNRSYNTLVFIYETFNKPLDDPLFSHIRRSGLGGNVPHRIAMHAPVLNVELAMPVPFLEHLVQTPDRVAQHLVAPRDDENPPDHLVQAGKVEISLDVRALRSGYAGEVRILPAPERLDGHDVARVVDLLGLAHVVVGHVQDPW